MRKKSILLSGMMILLLFVGIFTGCTAKTEIQKQEQKEETTASPVQEKTKMNIAVLKGPTGIGAVKLMEDSEKEETECNYEFEIAGAPDEVVAKIVSGEIDVAAVPTNLAATLYNKTDGNVEIAAINTLGVLYLLEKGDTIHSIEDLAGKTVYASGQGATPEYVLNYLLQSKGITDAKIEYKAEHAELATALLSGNADNGLLPEPNVTAVLLKDPEIRIALDLTEEWGKLFQGTEKEGNVLAMGCIIVRKDYLEKNPEAFNTFLKEYQASTHYANENIAQTAAFVEKYQIMASAAAAEKAIPNCNIVYIDGAEMKEAASAFFQVLYEANPKSIGGKLPEEDFYYAK